MSATVFYESGFEFALLSVQFQLGGVNTDPVAVSCVVTDPSGTVVTHTFAGTAPADIAKEAGSGAYQLAVQCLPAITGIDGLWSFVWVGAGTVNDVQPGTWRVLALDQARWYVGPEELKDRLGVPDTTDDSIIASVCLATSRWIDTYCGRHFFRLTDTRTYQPTDISLLNIDDLTTVTTLKIDMDGDGIYETSWVQGTNYQLRIGDGQFNQLASGEAKPYTQVQVIGGLTGGNQWFPFTWPFVHLDRVQITGVFGWPQVPPVVSQAALLIASDWFKLKDAPWGVMGIADLGIIRLNPNPWIAEQLRCYIKGRGKVGV